MIYFVASTLACVANAGLFFALVSIIRAAPTRAARLASTLAAALYMLFLGVLMLDSHAPTLALLLGAGIGIGLQQIIQAHSPGNRNDQAVLIQFIAMISTAIVLSQDVVFLAQDWRVIGGGFLWSMRRAAPPFVVAGLLAVIIAEVLARGGKRPLARLIVLSAFYALYIRSIVFLPLISLLFAGFWAPICRRGTLSLGRNVALLALVIAQYEYLETLHYSLSFPASADPAALLMGISPLFLLQGIVSQPGEQLENGIGY